jgi:thiamine kinase
LNQSLSSWQQWPIKLACAPRVIKRNEGGLTNESYLIQAGAQRFILRLNSLITDALGIDRELECCILKALSPYDIAPKLLHWDKIQNFTVLAYIDGRQWTQEDLKNKANQHALDQLITTIQSVVIPTPIFDYVHHVSRYWQQAITIDEQVKYRREYQWESFIVELQEWQCSGDMRVLCHHDLTPNNIIETPEGLKVIDWEYAGFGHPDFDRAYILRQLDEEQKNNDLLHELMRWVDYLWEVINR